MLDAILTDPYLRRRAIFVLDCWAVAGIATIILMLLEAALT